MENACTASVINMQHQFYIVNGLGKEKCTGLTLAPAGDRVFSVRQNYNLKFQLFPSFI